MMLIKKEVTELRKALASYKNPIFIHDDDPDGLCSFLLLYRMHREGRGVILKTSSSLNMDFVRLIKDYSFDSIFVLDIPIVEQEFIDYWKKPFFWVDHHEALLRENLKYFNPHIRDPSVYIPTSRMAYQISGNKEDLWLAMVGCLSDYMIPDFKDEFIKQYPGLMNKDSEIGDALFKDEIGKLEKIFRFLLKGKSSEVRKCIKILTRIKSPYEILRQESPAGKYLYKRFEKLDLEYQKVVKEAKSKRTRSKLMLYEYDDKKISFTAYLSNEISTLNPDKILIIARKHQGKIKMSLRAKVPFSDALKKALYGINGSGGGHPMACGAVVDENDWKLFLKQFKEELKEVKIPLELKLDNNKLKKSRNKLNQKSKKKINKTNKTKKVKLKN